MKKILILYTGGTIGMQYRDNKLVVDHGKFRAQLDSLAPIAEAQLELIEYDNLIDSSDITITQWVKIINDISSNYTKYDGFVVIHGTDTMAYTASILSFALRGLAKPVILTGAQLPLVHRRSDGWSNLMEAIYAAMQEDLQEVAIAFDHKLLRGCRTKKVSTYRFWGFDSVDRRPLADFGIHISWYKKTWMNNTHSTFAPIIPTIVKVLNLSLCPGSTTDLISEILATTNARGIVLQTYGSGNIPMSHPTLSKSIMEATNRGIVVVSVTKVIEGRVTSDYSNSLLNNLGVIGGSDMTLEAAFAKLTILLSSKMSTDEIKRAVATNLVGELTESHEH